MFLTMVNCISSSLCHVHDSGWILDWSKFYFFMYITRVAVHQGEILFFIWLAKKPISLDTRYISSGPSTFIYCLTGRLNESLWQYQYSYYCRTKCYRSREGIRFSSSSVLFRQNSNQCFQSLQFLPISRIYLGWISCKLKHSWCLSEFSAFALPPQLCT